MRVRLLGPVDVMDGGEMLPVSGLRRKAVLATLALHAGQVVGTGRLVDAVWGETAPAALNTLQSHVSYLRTVLGKAAIVARAPGYQLDLGDDGTDVLLAERLLRQGAQSADPARAAADLREALALWRGRPLADLAGLAWLEQQAGRLELLREQIRHALSDPRLAAGEHRQLVPELEQAAADHPLDEEVHAQLMTALYRSGRQADALAVYQRLRSTLAEELGLTPGPALRDLETAILRQDASLDASAPVASLRPAAPPASGVPVPAQLPPPVAGFAGRAAELARLDAIGGDQADEASAVTIAAITGTAGVGPASPGRPGGALPQPAGRPAGARAARQRARRRAGAPAAARFARVPGHRDQPQSPHRPDRRARRVPAGPGPADPGRRARAAGRAGGRRPGRPGTRRDRRDHRRLRTPSAGADHRRGPRRDQPGVPARRLRGRPA